MDWSDSLFLFVNAFSLFVTLVFLLTFLQNREKANKNPKPKRFPEITIVIPAFNESQTIRKTIRAVCAMNYPKRLRVIVVNDGSTDDTLELARREAVAQRAKADVRIVSQANKGKGAALNKGLSLARTELVATADADSYPEQDALLKTVGYFNDERVGSVTTSIKIHRPRSLVQFVQYVEYVAMNYVRKTSAFLQGITCIPGPLSVFRRKALIEVGGFDEKSIVEDTEVAYHLQHEGWRIENAFDAVVECETPYTLRGLVRQRVRWYHGVILNAGKYSKMFFNKKFGNLGWFILPTNFVAVGLAMFIMFRFLLLLLNKTLALVFGVATPASSAAAAVAGAGYAAPTGLNAVFAVVWSYFSMLFSPENIFSFDFLFVAIYLALVLVTLRVGFQAAGEKFRWKWIPIYVTYLFLYSFVVTTTWLVGLLRALAGVKPTWGRAAAKSSND